MRTIKNLLEETRSYLSGYHKSNNLTYLYDRFVELLEILADDLSNAKPVLAWSELPQEADRKTNEMIEDKLKQLQNLSADEREKLLIAWMFEHNNFKPSEAIICEQMGMDGIFRIWIEKKRNLKPAGLVRGDLFKPSGKWGYEVTLDMRENYEDDLIHDAVKSAWLNTSQDILGVFRNMDNWKDWWLVVIEPFHKHSHPVMLKL